MSKALSSFLEILTAVLVLLVLFLLAYSFWIIPTKIVKDSISPDGNYRVEVLTQGYWGRSSVKLVNSSKQDEQVEVYSESGNEVIFPKDTQIIWSKDSLRFLITSKSVSSILVNAAKNPLTYLTSEVKYKDNWKGKYFLLVLMYDVRNKEVWHNFFLDSKPFSRRDLREISWLNCDLCRN
jgi:hypothetical protein